MNLAIIDLFIRFYSILDISEITQLIDAQIGIKEVDIFGYIFVIFQNTNHSLSTNCPIAGALKEAFMTTFDTILSRLMIILKR